MKDMKIISYEEAKKTLTFVRVINLKITTWYYFRMSLHLWRRINHRNGETKTHNTSLSSYFRCLRQLSSGIFWVVYDFGMASWLRVYFMGPHSKRWRGEEEEEGRIPALLLIIVFWVRFLLRSVTFSNPFSTRDVFVCFRLCDNVIVDVVFGTTPCKLLRLTRCGSFCPRKHGEIMPRINLGSSWTAATLFFSCFL